MLLIPVRTVHNYPHNIGVVNNVRACTRWKCYRDDSDVIDAHLELMVTTNHVTDEVPTDIAAG